MRQDIAYIVAHARERDREELAEYGLTEVTAQQHLSAGDAVASRVFFHGNWPAAVVRFVPVTPKALGVEMIATDAWPHVVRAVMRWADHVRQELLLAGYARAECRTMDCHEDASRFLEALGFTLECRCPEYGASGKTFLQFAWRSRDHVLHAQDQRAADHAS